MFYFWEMLKFEIVISLDDDEEEEKEYSSSSLGKKKKKIKKNVFFVVIIGEFLPMFDGKKGWENS